MAGVGHLAVGLAAARFQTKQRLSPRPAVAALVFWSALSFLPDADVVGLSMGVAYGDPWGHRGATHSLAFAAALGAAVGLGARLFHYPAIRIGLLTAVVVASHVLLDTLTNGGLGCAVFWPFDATRYFAPWNPIPVSPIGLGIFSSYGMKVLVTETLLFAPLFWLLLRPSRKT